MYVHMLRRQYIRLAPVMEVCMYLYIYTYMYEPLPVGKERFREETQIAKRGLGRKGHTTSGSILQVRCKKRVLDYTALISTHVVEKPCFQTFDWGRPKISFLLRPGMAGTKATHTYVVPCVWMVRELFNCPLYTPVNLSHRPITIDLKLVVSLP